MWQIPLRPHPVQLHADHVTRSHGHHVVSHREQTKRYCLSTSTSPFPPPLGGVTRGGQCIFSEFLNSTRSAVSDPTSHYPRPPGKRPGGPKIPKIVTGSDQKIKIPKKKGVLGQGLYLAYSYFLAHKRDMAMATAHVSYFRK